MKAMLTRSLSMTLLAGLLAACSLPSAAGGAGGPTPIPGGAAAPPKSHKAVLGRWDSTEGRRWQRPEQTALKTGTVPHVRKNKEYSIQSFKNHAL